MLCGWKRCCRSGSARHRGRRAGVDIGDRLVDHRNGALRPFCGRDAAVGNAGQLRGGSGGASLREQPIHAITRQRVRLGGVQFNCTGSDEVLINSSTRRRILARTILHVHRDTTIFGGNASCAHSAEDDVLASIRGDGKLVGVFVEVDADTQSRGVGAELLGQAGVIGHADHIDGLGIAHRDTEVGRRTRGGSRHLQLGYGASRGARRSRHRPVAWRCPGRGSSIHGDRLGLATTSHGYGATGNTGGGRVIAWL